MQKPSTATSSATYTATSPNTASGATTHTAATVS
jgi:hypothetical protein